MRGGTVSGYPDIPAFAMPIEWRALRDAYRASRHEPIMLNQGGPAEQPFTVDFAIEWAERLARYAL